jgi:hypothetical protein
MRRFRVWRVGDFAAQEIDAEWAKEAAEIFAQSEAVRCYYPGIRFSPPWVFVGEKTNMTIKVVELQREECCDGSLARRS